MNNHEITWNDIPSDLRELVEFGIYTKEELINKYSMESSYTDKPTRCIDPVMKFCQECRYGWVHYPEWVETYEDTFDCTFESGCMYGLEDTEPTEEELKEFDEILRNMRDDNEYY